MAKEQVTLSHQELDRLMVVERIVSRQLTQAEAASQLGLSVRQVKRLVRGYRADGPSSLASRRRGRPPNNQIPDEVRQAAVGLVKEHYLDFGPTLAHEKLSELHDIRLSVETLRKWMVEEQIWKPKNRKVRRNHPHRPRRPCRGELVQIDGSHHDWFEGRAPICTLIVFIDDATSEVLALRFAPAETTEAYMRTLRDCIEQHGRPVSIYSDKHSVFRVNYPEREAELTQFTRALKTLDIEPIHANTPQAKGRVERANQTLQDRLVKELRLRGIHDINTANAFMDEYVEIYNARFRVPPANPSDAHRPVLHAGTALDLIFSLHFPRKLTRNLSLQFENGIYQLQGQGHGFRLRNKTVTVCKGFDGTITILNEGHVLKSRLLEQGEAPVPIESEKGVHGRVEQAKKRQQVNPKNKPAPDHPWNRMTRTAVHNASYR